MRRSNDMKGDMVSRSGVFVNTAELEALDSEDVCDRSSVEDSLLAALDTAEGILGDAIE